jgi:hypothetical protein
MNNKTFIVIWLAIALTSCSNAPSAADARTKLEAQIREQSNSLITLVSFQKTDGAMQEFMGMKGYQMSYAAEVEFNDDCLWSGGNNLMGWDGSFRAERIDPAPRGGVREFFYVSQGLKPAKKGERFRFTGHLNFEKTERGWH